MTPTPATCAVRIAIDLAKARLVDAQRAFEIAVREIALESAPEPGLVLDIATYTWTRPPSSAASTL